MMDLTKMLAELRLEREQIEEAMMTLARLARGRGNRRGRPPAWMSQLKRRGRPPGNGTRISLMGRVIQRETPMFRYGRTILFLAYKVADKSEVSLQWCVCFPCDDSRFTRFVQIMPILNMVAFNFKQPSAVE